MIKKCKGSKSKIKKKFNLNPKEEMCVSFLDQDLLRELTLVCIVKGELL